MTKDLEDKFSKEEIEFTKKVIDLIISANHTIFKIEDLSHVDKIWLKETKRYGNLFLKRLMKIEGHFDMLADNENTIKCFNDFQDYMKEVSSVSLNDVDYVTEILKASKKDKAMMLAMAKKVNELKP